MVKGRGHAVILGTPFINMLDPFKVFEEGIEPEVEGTKIKFTFSREPQIQYVNTMQKNIQKKKIFVL